MRGASTMAGALAGLAVWCTAGSLDAIDGPTGPIRLAMLPALWVGVLLGVLGAAAGRVVPHLIARVATGRWAAAPADHEVCLPLAASGLLVLPFLPFLADHLPVLTVLAGPFASLVWTVTIGLGLRAAWLRVRREGRWPQPRWPVPLVVVGLAVNLVVCGTAAARLAGTPIFPGGDEPHYLVIAQSLWRDGDFKIENNHTRGDTLEYFGRPLKPDYLTRGVDGEIYSIHPVGIAILLAPIYALGGYGGVVAFLVVVAAAAATCAWRVTTRLTDGVSGSVAGLACALSAPWVFNSFAVYPEVTAALAVLVVVAAAFRLDEVASARQLLRWMAGCGVAVAVLPWLSSKYSLMGAALGVILLGRLWWPSWLNARGAAPPPVRPVRERLAASAVLALAPLLSGLAWLAFFKSIWGTFSPSAPYADQRHMALSYFWAGAPGLFFDQEYGVVAAAPVLLLGLLGLGTMVKQGGPSRRIAFEIGLLGASLLATVAAFHIWWGGTAIVGRPIISALLLLMVPCAWQLREWSASRALTSAAWLLLLASVAMTVTLGVAQNGLLLAAERDGTARLLGWWSPLWPLWSAAPTFIVQPAWRGTLVTAVWLAAIVGGLVALKRAPTRWSDGRAGLAAAMAGCVVLVLAGTAGPVVASRPVAGGELSRRPRSPLLDDYDARRRPLAIAYDPWRLVAPVEIASRVTFVARRGETRVSTAARLLHEARWAWPAGEYEVRLSAPADADALAGSLSLQAGRSGAPLATWTLEDRPRVWRQRFALPIDVGFVGFLASPELVARAPVVDVRPVRLVDTSRRLPWLDVEQARRVGDVVVFFHDLHADPERTGFWTRRDTVSRVTFDAASPPVLRLRAGPAATTVVLWQAGRRQRIDLAASGERDLTLDGAQGPWRVEIDTRGGFVPAETDPASRDRRALGCWFEVRDGR